MKVIFLDIDGVLNTSHTVNPRKLPYVVEKKLVKRLKGILAKSRAKVVLSSTWRYDPAGLFSATYHGIPYFDCIPDMPRRARRDEILAWLKKHPRVSRFAVLDDDDDELDGMPLFQPDPGIGLTSNIARGLSDYLNKKTDADMRRSAVVRIARNLANAFSGHRG